MEAYRYKEYIDENLPGGDNYREVVFELADAKGPSNASLHFDEENYLAHALVRDRKLTDNTKTLHIDELQSDLHKQAKDFEYATPENINKINKKLEEDKKNMSKSFEKLKTLLEKYDLSELPNRAKSIVRGDPRTNPVAAGHLINDITIAFRLENNIPSEIKKARRDYQNLKNVVGDTIGKKNRLLPDYPYKENWHTVVINRLLAEAIDEGYDAISLSPAKVLSDRYTDSYEEFYSNLYDKKVPSYLKKLARRYKGKFEKGKLDIDDTFGMGTEKFLAAPETGLDRRRKLSEVNILRITPEMREMLEKEGLQAFNEGGLVGDKINILELIKANIREKEGLKLEAYKPIPTEEYYTIGYGRYSPNIKKGDVITQEQAEQYLDEDVSSRLKEVNRLIPDFNSYPPEVQVPLFSEYYRGSIKQSPKTIELLRQKKYEEAATEFLNNEEYRRAEKLGKAGIKPRMEEAANAIRLLG